MDINISSLQELYERLRPALTTKKEEMKRDGYNYIKEEDIWNYLKETKWKKSIDLELYQMVSDIMNAENNYINEYLKEKLYSRSRVKYFEGDEDEE